MVVSSRRALWLVLAAAFAQPLRGGEPAHLREVPFTRVTIHDRLFERPRAINRSESLLHSLEMLEQAGNMRNLERARKGEHTGYEGPVFMDSDLYKVIEACAYSLATDPDPKLDARLDDVIAKIAAAQLPDGYIDTWYQVNAPDKRFTNLRDHHEMYCAGHMFEAAAAHFQATGKRSLLDVATKCADLLCKTFGDGPGKRAGYCGHPEVELALVKLADVTGDAKYFDLAKHFIDARGTKFFATEHGEPLDTYDGGYCQDSVPIRELAGAVGHAVRFGYLMSGATDVAARTNDASLIRMLKRTWKNIAEKNTFITGGIGPSGSNEGFTHDYDLPTFSAYQETCATIALAQWSHRMNLLLGDAKYADAVETALMNGVLAGVSQDGLKYFYVNPLASRGDHHRTPWFSCACCPPNVARTLSSLGSYVYAVGDDGVRVNMYVQGEATIDTKSGALALDVKSEYPFDGAIRITVKSAIETALHLRVPGWCDDAKVLVNGQAFDAPREKGYAIVRRAFAAGDTVDVNLALPIRRIEAHPEAKDLRGLAAFARGPIVYAFEQCDQSAPLDAISIPFGAHFEALPTPDIATRIPQIRGDAWIANDPRQRGALYRTVQPPKNGAVIGIPYALWDNREPGAMRVWFPASPPPAAAFSLETDAKVSVSFKHWNSQPEGVHDGIEPKSSAEQEAATCHWWNHEGGTEWVRYDWSHAITTRGVKVYWFDDTGIGACRVPKSWRLLANVGDHWAPVEGASAYEIATDRWCEVTFPSITTTGLRIEVVMQDGFAAGVQEWKVIEADAEDD